MIESTNIVGEINYEIAFTICTLVTDISEYQVMLESFEKAGFNSTNSEFLHIDNSTVNTYDAYSGGNLFISKARGKYIIICHQDVEILDTRDKLESCLDELNKIDNTWAICGNAGAVAPNYVVYHIAYPDNKLMSKGRFPIQVKSLDENFLLIRKEAMLSFSNDLKGFHMYGADICLQANTKGNTAYVIAFKLLHKSRGKPDQSFDISKKALQKKYSHQIRPRWIQTTITKFYISGTILGYMVGNPIFLLLIRLYYGLMKKIVKTGKF